MSFFSEAAKGVDGEAAAALEGITNVRVRVYEGIGDDMGDAAEVRRRHDDDGSSATVGTPSCA